VAGRGHALPAIHPSGLINLQMAGGNDDATLRKQHLWQEGTDLRAWLFTLLHNQYVNDVRRAVRQGNLVEMSARTAESEPSLSRAAGQEKSVELRDLDRALAKLPDEQRAAILLIGLEGIPYEAAAEILGIPVGTVRSRLSRGREELRRLMGERTEKRGRPSRAEATAA
jgi:RNA polymerase sigma-70 factor (ECF subfamily)